MRRTIALALLAVATVVTAGYFAFAFSDTSLWLDEAYSVLVAERSPGAILEVLRTDNGPPLYYFLLKAWIAVFGDGERAIRALSGIAYLATGGVLYWGGRRVWATHAAGIAAAALYLCSPLAVRHTFSARMYALLGLVTAVSVVLFIRAVRAAGGSTSLTASGGSRGASGGSRGASGTSRDARGTSLTRSGWALLALHSLGLFLQYWVGFVIAAEAIAAAAIFRAKPRFLLWLVAPFLPFAILWGPFLVAQLHAGGSAWIKPVQLSDLFATFADFYGRGISIAAFVVFAAMIAVGPRRKLAERLGGREGAALALICVVSVLVPFLVSQLKPIYFVGRYTLVALPPFALWMGGVLTRAAPSLSPALITLLIAVRVLSTTGDQRAWHQQDAAESSRTAARRILAEAPQGTVLVYSGLGGVTLAYYLDRSPRTFEQHTFPEELERHPGWMRVDRMMARKGELQAEAEELVATLSTAPVIWHVYEDADPVAHILQRVLVQARGEPRTSLLLGSFHDSVSAFGGAP